jgi:hypothetical protein
MKKLILLCCLSLAGNLFAQKTGTYSFQLTISSEEEADTADIDIHLNADYFAMSTSFSYDVDEKILVDIKNKRVLELLNEEETDKEYYNSFWETSSDEIFMVSESSDFLSPKTTMRESIRLESEKKTRDGFNCQKISLMDEEQNVVGTGWMALGLHLAATDELAFFDTAEGTIISYDLEFDGAKSTLRLVAKTPTVINPNAAFNFEIPAGYVDGDELLEGDYSDEEYSDEEEDEEE